jgi:hypothetical protein
MSKYLTSFTHGHRREELYHQGLHDKDAESDLFRHMLMINWGANENMIFVCQ